MNKSNDKNGGGEDKTSTFAVMSYSHHTQTMVVLFESDIELVVNVYSA